MFFPSPRQLSVIKGLLFVLALLPFLHLVYAAMLAPELLGANPVEYITRDSGDWTLYLLCITLAITPLRRLSGLHWVIRLRRMLGLFTFFYAFLHFSAFFGFDHAFELQDMWKDVVKRPFIAVGFAAFVLLVPLAVTSSNDWIRRLGGRRWQMLHRIVYGVLVLGVLHFWWMKAGKNDLAKPALFAAIAVVLLGLRAAWALKARRERIEAAGGPLCHRDPH